MWRLDFSYKMYTDRHGMHGYSQSCFIDGPLSPGHSGEATSTGGAESSADSISVWKGT
jgi:hypothetical protein